MISGVNWDVFRQLSYGLYVVTSIAAGKGNGQVVNTVLQVTSNPPRVAVIINKANLTHEYLNKSGLFGVSVLDTSAPLTFIGLFGFRTGRDVDKLSQATILEGLTGCPLVTDHCLAVLEARVLSQVDLGTHTLFVGDVLGSEVLREGEPMTYQFYQSRLKGKMSRNSPTFNPNKQ